MGEIKFIGSLVLISLFAIAVIGYSVGFANDNNSNINLADDPQFSSMSSGLKNNITDFKTDTADSSEVFFKSTVGVAQETTVTGGDFKLGLGSLMASFGVISSAINTNIFGGSAVFGIVLTALSSFLVYSGFRYIWKTWKGGNPD